MSLNKKAVPFPLDGPGGRLWRAREDSFSPVFF
jgi:hypothetical protein